MRLATLVITAILVGGCRDQAPDVDTKAPAVTSTVPAAGAQNVTLQTRIILNFGEPVTLVTGDSAIVLTYEGVTGGTAAAQVVSGTAVVQRDGLEFTPADVLEPGATYSVHARFLAKDASGNQTRDSLSWTFRTVGPAPSSASLALPFSDLLRTDLEKFAHDSMRGRGSGTADELRAAQYVRSRFEHAQLEPPTSGYLQTFTVPGRVGVTSQNVIGLLPGSGALRDQYVVVGAHYDHVGVRTVGGVPTIFNGADDNGSGAIAVVELADIVGSYFRTTLPNEPRRSIIFIAFGAEELGLLGSEYYCAHPTYPIAAAAAMVNFDMIGRMQNHKLYVGGVPSSPAWPDLVARYKPNDLDISTNDCAGCTDYACFRKGSRPVLWLFTGLHPDYHAPTDDVERINAEGMAKTTDLALHVIVNLALRRYAPAFTP